MAHEITPADQNHVLVNYLIVHLLHFTSHCTFVYTRSFFNIDMYLGANQLTVPVIAVQDNVI